MSLVQKLLPGNGRSRTAHACLLVLQLLAHNNKLSETNWKGRNRHAAHQQPYGNKLTEQRRQTKARQAVLLMVGVG